MASVGDKALLAEFLLKRSKSMLSTKATYQGRYFVLSTSSLSLHEGTLEGGKPERLKSRINLPDIRAVELVDETSVEGRKYAFQVVYQDNRCKLIQMVIVAQHQERLREWIEKLVAAWKNNAGSMYKTKYHPGAWQAASKSYPCCANKNDQSEGCCRTVITPKDIEQPYEKHQHEYNTLKAGAGLEDHLEESHSDDDCGYEDVEGLPHEYLKAVSTSSDVSANYTYIGVDSDEDSVKGQVKEKPKVAPKPLTKKPKKIVVAKEDYQYVQENCLQLTKGEKCTIVDESDPDWWMAVKKNGEQGYVRTRMVEEVKTGANMDADNAISDSEDKDYVEAAYVGKKTKGPAVKDNLEQQEWYYPKISREECEDILTKEAVVGCFLVRPSSQSNCHALSLYYEKGGQGVVEHYLIRQNKLGHYYMFDEPPRATLSEVIRIHMHTSGELATRLICSPAQTNRRYTYDFTNHEINMSDLEMKETVGRGQFGVVQKACWKGKIIVAVKMMRSDVMSHEDFVQEAKTMLRLQHVRLVQLYGVVPSADGEFLKLVTEFMANGSLYDYLRSNGKDILKSEYRPVRICHQICLAMEYLESQSFIHRDLAARNCLVGPNEVIKVGDFGLARYMLEGVYIGSYGTQFAPQWAPPEVLKDKIFTSKSDVWSFGVVMWEVYTGGRKRPYGAMPSLEVIERVVCMLKTRLAKPEHCSEAIYDIMMQCWAHEAVKRPMFCSLRKALAKHVEIEDSYTTVPIGVL